MSMSERSIPRIRSAESITAAAADSGGMQDRPALIWPERASVFAERQMRLRQLAQGHAMSDFLGFMAELARVQQNALCALQGEDADAARPDASALVDARRLGLPPLPAADGPRDSAWRGTLRAMLQGLRANAQGDGVQRALDAAQALNDDALERQADGLLHGVMHGLNLATAPLVAAALQVHWTHRALGLRAQGWTPGGPSAPDDADRAAQTLPAPADAACCPCCGSRPVASLTQARGDASGQRYLQCSLCSLQWLLPRVQCARCMATERIFYHSLERAQASADETAAHAAQAVVQAECCSDCGHYLKIVHRDRDAFADAVADDLATLTLDLLVSEAGLQRHGVNLMLLFGDPAPAAELAGDPVAEGR